LCSYSIGSPTKSAEDENHPLASLMDVLGVLIEKYEDEHACSGASRMRNVSRTRSKRPATFWNEEPANDFNPRF
jgi:hypothetical protein